MMDKSVLKALIGQAGKAYAPELTEEIKRVLTNIRGVKESLQVTFLSNFAAKRLEELYGFREVEPARWGRFSLWKSPSLPDNAWYVVQAVPVEGEAFRTGERSFMLMLAEKRVWNDGWYVFWKEGSLESVKAFPVREGKLSTGMEAEDFFVPLEQRGWQAGQVWVLAGDSRDLILRHVNITLRAIEERGMGDIPLEFVAGLHVIVEALR